MQENACGKGPSAGIDGTNFGGVNKGPGAEPELEKATGKDKVKGAGSQLSGAHVPINIDFFFGGLSKIVRDKLFRGGRKILKH